MATRNLIKYQSEKTYDDYMSAYSDTVRGIVNPKEECFYSENGKNPVEYTRNIKGQYADGTDAEWYESHKTIDGFITNSVTGEAYRRVRHEIIEYRGNATQGIPQTVSRTIIWTF